MDSQTLRTKYADLSRALAEIEVSSDMTERFRVATAGQLDILAADAERNLVPETDSSTDADVRDDGARFFRQLAMTNSWLDGRDSFTRAWIDRAAELACTDVLQDMLRNEQNSLRDNEAFAGIYALCRQGRVDKARRQLVARRKAAADPITRKRIDEILADPRNLMGPLASPPTLQTINGFGMMMHGSRDRGTDGTYVATLCLTVLFIPLLPIRAYLVRQEGAEGWRFFGRVPLSAFAFWYRRSVLLAPLLVAFWFWGIGAYNSSPYVSETRRLSAAETHLAKKDYAAAIKALAPMAATTDKSRAARLDELANKTLAAALNSVKGPHDGGTFLGTTGQAASGLRRRWSAGTEAAAVSAFERAGYGKTARDFLYWYGVLFPDSASKRADMAVKACENGNDPMVLALAADLSVEAKRPCPPEILARLKGLLVRSRHATWNHDTMSYIRAADPAQSKPVVLLRCEAAWTAREPGNDLAGLENLPRPLLVLLALDNEASLEKRAAGLEKAADPGDLEDPMKSWHRLGAARRLLKTYGALNEKDPIRFPVSRMRKWAVEAAELAPEDAETRVTALRHLLEDGEFAKVISIGDSVTGDPKTATLVAIALARSGKTEEAGNRLRPIVERDLPEFTSAIQEWEKAFNARMAAVWKTLENGTANRAVLARLNALPKDQVQTEADKWVRKEAERDMHVFNLGKKWRDRADIHPAASELAMVELTLGRTLPPGAKRQERLEAAERLFLELRKVMRDDPHQELQLGQVYFWLGKDQEGAEIFDRIEAEGDPQVLHELGEIYRGFSREEASRRVLEAAYAKADESKKGHIAMTRALATFDFEDRLAWLRKSHADDPRVKADIDQTEALIAESAGRHADAVAPLRRVIAYYAGLPESATSLNNGAIASRELARATGDQKHQLDALRMVRRSYELNPEDAIVLGNYVDSLQDIGVAALAGNVLRTDVLHELPGRSWLDYAVPKPSSQELAALVKAQPELRRAAELAPKAVILSPDRHAGYSAQSRFFSLTQDGAALKRLREAVESRPPARTEGAARDKAHARGEYTESEKRAVERYQSSTDLLVDRVRKAGHGPTLAYGLLKRVAIRVNNHRQVRKGPGLDAALKDAEEALAAFDGSPTRYTMAWVRSELAAVDVAAADQEFARWLQENPTIDSGSLLPLYVRKHPERAAAILAREPVRKATEAAVEAAATSPSSPATSNWAWLEMAGHEARETVRNQIRNHPTFLESQRLDRLLSPYDPVEVLSAWLAATAAGEKELADWVAARAKADGVFPLFFK